MTWSVTVVERETAPLAPSIVSVKVPVLAVVLVEMVSTADDEVGFGSNVAVAPELRPLTLRVTAPSKPFWGVMVTWYFTEPPRTTLWLDGEAVSPKSVTTIVVGALVLLPPALEAVRVTE